MDFSIELVMKEDYSRLVQIWEESVLATHHFLPDDYRIYIKSILTTFFDSADMRCVCNQENEIVAFSGIEGNKMEMLFVDPKWFGKGIGKLLLEYAFNNQKVTEVDVNQQNVQAVKFYLKMGFTVKNRLETDGLGKPFPLLELSIK